MGITIEERTRLQEKSQFTEEEYNSLHDKHDINSPFGIGYYVGATEQKKIDIENMRWFLMDNCMGMIFTSVDLEKLIKAMGG